MPFRAPVKIWICLCMGRCRLPADNPYTKGRRNWNKGVLKAPLLFHFVERRRTLDMFPLLSSEEINGAIVTVFKRSKIRLFTEHTKTERNTLSLPWNTAAVWPACLPCKDRWCCASCSTLGQHKSQLHWENSVYGIFQQPGPAQIVKSVWMAEQRINICHSPPSWWGWAGRWRLSSSHAFLSQNSTS